MLPGNKPYSKIFFFFSSRRRHTRFSRDWSSDVCSSDLAHSFGRKHVGPGDEVVITWMEHHSNIVPWQLLCQEKGAHLRVVPITDAGELRLEELDRLLTPRSEERRVGKEGRAGWVSYR